MVHSSTSQPQQCFARSIVIRVIRRDDKKVSSHVAWHFTGSDASRPLEGSDKEVLFLTLRKPEPELIIIAIWSPGEATRSSRTQVNYSVDYYEMLTQVQVP